MSGSALSGHPDVDMVSFTGSTRAGIEVARNAAPTVKRVAQELGGKSANIVLDDDVARASPAASGRLMGNTGQTCNAPTRMLVPSAPASTRPSRSRRRPPRSVTGRRPDDGPSTSGPVVSGRQWDKIQGLIEGAIEEGARWSPAARAGPDGSPSATTSGRRCSPTSPPT